MSREVGDESLMDLGFASMHVADFMGAGLVCEEAVALARAKDDEHALCLSPLELGIVYIVLQDWEATDGGAAA